MHKDQRMASNSVTWRANPQERTAWRSEWDVLLDAIHKDKPHNEAKRAAHSNLADLMARAAAHMGKVVTWEEMLASDFQFCPDIEKLNAESPAPVQADAQGRYPTPVPGQWVEV